MADEAIKPNCNTNCDFPKLCEKELKDPFETYKNLLDTRKFEIDLFWKRALFFWGFITVVGGAYISGKIPAANLFFVSIIGFLFSLIFSLSTRGSKYWQEHWELLIVKYEREKKFAIYRFGTGKIIKERNKKSCYLAPQRFSVSKLTMVVSDITAVAWLIAFIRDVSHLLEWHPQFPTIIRFCFGLAFLIFWVVIIIRNIILRRSKSSLNDADCELTSEQCSKKTI